MKAIILAGGRGTRLKPVTDYVPKPLVPINNIPIIELQIRYLKRFGIKEFIICTGYKTEQIENFFKAKNNLGVKISYSIEKTALGTGGAIKKASKLIKEKSFLVINGDVITNIDIRKLQSKLNSIAIIPLKTRYGIVEVADDKIVQFKEKKDINDLWMNAGIYHLSKLILKDLPQKGQIENTVFPKYAKAKKLFNIKFKGVIWYSIDSFKDLEECSRDLGKIIK